MGQLGDFLERFYSPEANFESVQGVIRSGKKGGVFPMRNSICEIGRRNPNYRHPTMARETKFWMQCPNKARAETTHKSSKTPRKILELTDGKTFWRRGHDGSLDISPAFAARRHRLPTEVQRHCDMGFLRDVFAALSFQEIGDCERFGRKCFEFRATPVEGQRLWPHWLPYGDDEYVFVADCETCIVLEICGYTAGELIEKIKVVELAIDDPINDDRFVWESKVSDAEANPKQIECISLEQASSKCSFTVLRPDVSQASAPRIQYTPARNNSGEKLDVFYRVAELGDAYTLMIDMCKINKLDDVFLWETFSKDDQEYNLSDPETESAGDVKNQRILRFQKHGTWCVISSDLPTSELISLAESMRPVEKG